MYISLTLCMCIMLYIYLSLGTLLELIQFTETPKEIFSLIHYSVAQSLMQHLAN